MDAAPPITHGHSRLTFVEADPFDLGPSSWGGVREAIRVKLTVDGKTLNAFVTHLDWPADDDWTDANEEHVQNRNNLAAKLDLFSGYKIFGGDFNAPYTREFGPANHHHHLVRQWLGEARTRGARRTLGLQHSWPDSGHCRFLTDAGEREAIETAYRMSGEWGFEVARSGSVLSWGAVVSLFPVPGGGCAARHLIPAMISLASLRLGA